MFTPTVTEHNALSRKIAVWWRGLRHRHVDLVQLEAGGDMRAIAQDAGLSVSDLSRLVARGSDAAELNRRMAALGLDPASLSHEQPAVARDLQRTCSLCTSKRRCRHDLAARPADSKWQTYCPNSSTLKSLQA